MPIIVVQHISETLPQCFTAPCADILNMSGRWSPNPHSTIAQLNALSSIGGVTRCLILFRHNVTFIGSGSSVRGATRSLGGSFCSNWGRMQLWGWVRETDVSHTQISLTSMFGSQRQPWTSDALERERRKALLIGCKWAPHGPLVVGLLTLIRSELELTWTPSMSAAAPHKTTFPWHIGYKHFVNHAAGPEVSLCF